MDGSEDDFEESSRDQIGSNESAKNLVTGYIRDTFNSSLMVALVVEFVK